MTNKEIIQLFAEYRPSLIAKSFGDCYLRGTTCEYLDDNKIKQFWSEEWLDSEYDKNLFDERDVEAALKVKTKYNKSEVRKKKNQ